MTTKAVCPANTDCLGNHADYDALTRHGDGEWTVKVRDGYYAPPEGWAVQAVSALPDSTHITVVRE